MKWHGCLLNEVLESKAVEVIAKNPRTLFLSTREQRTEGAVGLEERRGENATLSDKVHRTPTTRVTRE